jgi:glucan-binding YG repeat protein
MEKICPHCGAMQVILRDKNGNIIPVEEKNREPAKKTPENEPKKAEPAEEKVRKRSSKKPLVFVGLMVIAVVFASNSKKDKRINTTVAVKERTSETSETESQVISEEEGTAEKQGTESGNWSSTEGVQPEYLIYDGTSRYLSREELKYFTAWDLRLARNEIFARRGRAFQDEMLAAYFSSKSWYSISTSSSQYDYEQLNVYEKANISLIQDLEQTAKTLEWHQKGDEWYGLEPTGVPLSGWIHNNGFYYYLEEDGRMQSGLWEKGETIQGTGEDSLEGYAYFFLADGSLYEGLVYCDDQDHNDGLTLWGDAAEQAGLSAYSDYHVFEFREDGTFQAWK